jgi:hypothetical protein
MAKQVLELGDQVDACILVLFESSGDALTDQHEQITEAIAAAKRRYCQIFAAAAAGDVATMQTCLVGLRALVSIASALAEQQQPSCRMLLDLLSWQVPALPYHGLAAAAAAAAAGGGGSADAGNSAAAAAADRSVFSILLRCWCKEQEQQAPNTAAGASAAAAVAAAAAVSLSRPVLDALLRLCREADNETGATSA